jgi:hypothetical protein
MRKVARRADVRVRGPENGLGLGGLFVGIHHERSASDHGLTERFACHHQYPRMAVSVLTVIVVSV